MTDGEKSLRLSLVILGRLQYILKRNPSMACDGLNQYSYLQTFLNSQPLSAKCSNGIYTGVKLGHMKNAHFGLLTIAMYTTPKIALFDL